MSLILDALNRSRGEADEVPGLATQHYAQSPVAGPGWRRILPWAALGIAVVIIVVLLLRDSGEERRSAVSEPVAPVAAPGPAPVREPDPVAAVPPAPATAPVAPSVPERPVAAPAGPDPEVAALYRQPRPEKTPAASTAALRPSPASATDTAKPAAQKQQASTGEATAREEPVDIGKLVAAARRELANSELAEHAAPFLVELSQHTKDQIPTIFYQRHDYTGDAARSTVVLNGKQLRAGGMAAPGVKVEEILPDSVVLSFQGREFRLRALNSWVNL